MFRVLRETNQRAPTYDIFTGHQYAPARELREALDRDFTIPADIMRIYHYAKKPVFLDANGVEI